MNLELAWHPQPAGGSSGDLIWEAFFGTSWCEGWALSCVSLPLHRSLGHQQSLQQDLACSRGFIYWTDGWMDGWMMDGWMDGWMGGWMDG